MTGDKRDLTRTTLAVMSVSGLIIGTVWILRPFIPAIIWAITLVLATWPVLLQVQRRTGGRRGVAVAIMTIGLLLLLVAPLSLAVVKVVENIDQISAFIGKALSLQWPPMPAWVGDLPLVGERLAQLWQDLSDLTIAELAPRLSPYAGTITHWFVASVGGVGSMLIQFLLTIAIAAVLYANGEYAARTALRFGHRLGAERGEAAVRLAGAAVRGVALGVVVTALVQCALGGIGLAISGVPFATLLTAVMFILCLAQAGPGLILLPAVGWLFWSGATLQGAVLTGFTVIALTMDNVVRPLMIRTGAPLPLLLILAGVLGGLMAAGLLGIFVGPTVLAVAYTLVMSWIGEEDPGPARQGEGLGRPVSERLAGDPADTALTGGRAGATLAGGGTSP
ncbi:AI-2E family transporter YdiK [Rhodopila sp.]|jgi:predicted PurR-regulated permease PerM|uniref:AI-2E family transporter YdiK n=1 Tax=Rhodopila sp. TaxID=2480087 RepID=UPI002BF4DAB6|nr:AI-2E family transporter YdiK [Rhodopila sp.]HVZ07187.1 AI-2E family transporter YdiK [Rhodopila sp.]